MCFWRLKPYMSIQKIINRLVQKDSLGFIFVFLLLIFTYRDVFIQGKIVFPSNFLAESYSPWSTQKFKGWENGIPHKPIGGNDQIRFFYPLRTFTNVSLKNGSIPLWDPFIFSGNPHLADFQAAVFYPLNAIYNFVPQIFAWSILILIQPLLAMFFTYLYLRLFPIEKIAAFLGALAFGFSGFIISWSQENAVVSQTALWLPLTLFAVEGFVRKRNVEYFLLSAAALVFSFLAGFFQVAFYIFILVSIYGFLRIWQTEGKRLKGIIALVLMFIFSLAIGAIQLLPSIEAFIESPRSTTSASYIFDQYLLPITHIANILTPDIFGNPGSYNFFGRTFYNETVLYIGVVPLFFALYSFLKFKKDHIVTFFVGSAIVSFFLTINSPFTKWFFSLPIPLVSTFVPSRIISITTFSLAVLSAFGFSDWLKTKKNNKHENLIFIILVFVMSIELIYGLTLLSDNQNLSLINNYVIRPESHLRPTDILVMLKNLLLPSLLLFISFVAIRFGKKDFSVAMFLVILTIFSQFYFLNKYLVLGFPQFLYPSHPVFSFLQNNSSTNRFLTLGQPILSDISVQENIYSPEGLDPIYPNRYGQLLFATKNGGKLTNNIPRIEASLFDLSNDESIMDDERRLRLLSLLGVKYIAYYENSDSKISLTERFPQDIFIPIASFEKWHIFQYKNSLPRVFTTQKITVNNSPQEILNLIFDKKFDLSNVVLNEAPPGFKPTESSDTLNFSKITKYEPEKIEINTKTNSGSILFLSDNYYPGWKAFVDRKQVKIYRADYAFRAIVVSKGNHKEVFIYDPESFKTGAFVSVASIILFILIFLAARNRRL